MANVKISELASAVTLDDADQMVVVNGSATKKLTLADLTTFVSNDSSAPDNFKRAFVLGEDLNAGDVVRFEPDDSVKRVFGGEVSGEGPLAIGSIFSAELDTNVMLYCYDASPADGSQPFRVGHVIAGEVVGNDISYGTPIEFGTAFVNIISIAKLGTDKVLIAYTEGGTQHLRVINASGTVLTVGAANGLPYGNATKGLFSGGIDVALQVYKDEINDDVRVAKITVVADTPTVSTGTLLTEFNKSIATATNFDGDSHLVVYSTGAGGTTLSTIVVDNSGAQPVLGLPIDVSAGSTTFTTFTATTIDATNCIVGVSFPEYGISSIFRAAIAGTVVTLPGYADLSYYDTGSMSIELVSPTLAVAVFDNAIGNGSGTGTVTIDLVPTDFGIGPLKTFNLGLYNGQHNVIPLSADTFLVSYGSESQVKSRVGHIDGTAVCYETRAEYVGILEEGGLTGESKNVVVSGIHVPGGTLVPGTYQISRSGTITPFDVTDLHAPKIGRSISTTEFLVCA